MMKITRLFVLCGVLLLLLTGCNKNYDKTISYVDFKSKEVSLNNITYKFIGKSKNFGFETGNVNLNDHEKQLLITNFKQINKIDKFDTISFNIKFKDTLWAKSSWSKNDNISFKQYLKKIILYENYSQLINHGDDSFTSTTKETFKNDINITVEYCVNGQCKNETFKIEYVND